MNVIRIPPARLLAAFLVAALPCRAQPAEGWETFADGSVGRVTEYLGVNDTPIAAYLRKPKGDGPFPVVVIVHGGGNSREGTYALGRLKESPTASFIAAGWAVYSIDFRPQAPLQPIEWEDALLAVEALKKIPGLDGSQVAMFGNSHGGYNTARAASRIDLRCAIPCAAAAIDPIEVAKAHQAGEAVNQRALDAIRRQAESYGLTLEQLIAQPPPNYNTPLTEVDQVRCPILIISGRNDPASPPSVMETYAARLRAAGKEVELYLPDNGPHGFVFGRPRIPETEEAARRMVAFMAKHFGLTVPGAPRPAPASVSAPTIPADQRVLELFRRLDQNGDRRISGPESASEPGRRFVGRFDRNADGIVTLAEIEGQEPPPAFAVRNEAQQSRTAPKAGQAPVIPERMRTPIRELLEQGKVRWHDARTDKAEGMLLRTYRSAIIGGNISYLIHLPRSYARDESRRFPVVYWLHGGGGTQRDCWKFLEEVKKGNADGSCPEMVVVGVNGIASSIYSDSKDGKLPFESVIIKELIPHIDQTYRTIADRAGRALEGFSMGGFGVYHLGFKFPELFGALTALGPALLEFDSGAGNVEGALRHGPYEGDREYFRINDPFYLVEKNAAVIRGRTAIRLLDNEQTNTFTYRRSQEFIAHLKKLNIACEYRRLAGTGHNYERYYNEYPGSVAFYAMAFKQFVPAFVE